MLHGWSFPRHLTLTWRLGCLPSIMINLKLGQSIYLFIIVNIMWYVMFICGIYYSFQSPHLLSSWVGKPPLLHVGCSFVPLLLVVFFLPLQSWICLLTQSSHMFCLFCKHLNSQLINISVLSDDAGESILHSLWFEPSSMVLIMASTLIVMELKLQINVLLAVNKRQIELACILCDSKQDYPIAVM